MLNIKFPDGTIKKFEKGITPYKIASVLIKSQIEFLKLVCR